MASPSKINAETLLLSSQIEFRPLNFEKYEDLLEQISEDQLIEFIKARADLAKQELIIDRDQLREEYNTVSQMVKELDQMVKEKEIKVLTTTEKRKKESDMIVQLKRENEELEIKIKKLKDKLEGDEEMNKALKEQEEAAYLITPDLIKKVYAFLEKKSNEAGVYVLEALVGTMRGMKMADNLSVELYLKKHEGFMMGLKRVYFGNLNPIHCEEHLQNLQEKYDAIINEPQNAIFKPFRDLLTAICKMGKAAKEYKSFETKLEEKEEKLKCNIRDIELKEVMLSNIDTFETIKEDYLYYKNTQLLQFLEKQKRLKQELVEVDKKIHDFESFYFNGI